MAYKQLATSASRPYQRLYTNLKGVDFSSIPSRVSVSRSPDAKNVYKNYNSQLGQAIETRPGINLLGDLSNLFEQINLVNDYNFASGVLDDGWLNSGLETMEIVGEELVCLSNSTNDACLYYADDTCAGHKVYACARIRSVSAYTYFLLHDGITWSSVPHSGSGQYEMLSRLITVDISPSFLRIGGLDVQPSAPFSTYYLDYACLIDLTALFGQGQEPTADEMDGWITEVLSRTTNKVYGLHVLGDGKALIHIERDLYIWKSFPDEISSLQDIQKINITMNKEFSQSFKYTDGGITKLYLLDGENYLVYDGENVSDVVGTIPLTRINALPGGSGGVIYQGVNYLSSYRKNSFIGDGSSLNYSLDTVPTDSEGLEVYINGVEKESGVSLAGSVVTLDAPAGAPATPGQDNVVIVFKKEVDGYAEHIKRCKLCRVFDNRVFVSGNDSYRGVLFHSELDDPAYYADESWYDDGADNTPVRAIIASSDKLICIKDDNGEGVKVYFHTSSLDSALGRIYPMTESPIHLGAAAGGINFRDAVVYLSKQGLENIISNEYGIRLYHKSGMVDTKLMNEAGLDDAKLEVWNNYLCVLINGRIYLADSRQISDHEYEWYYWEDIGILTDEVFSKATVLKEYLSELYLATEGGQICKFFGTHDDSLIEGVNTPTLIDSYWTTPMDIFNSLTHLKTTNKRGGVAQVKRIPNSILKIDVKTDKEDWITILSSATQGFNFLDFLYFLREEEGYERFSFGTGVRGFLVFKVKKRKIKQFSIKFYSDEVDKPFGLYEATVEFTIGNYVKN